MTDFSVLKRRFRQFGGMKLVREYTRAGLLWPICREFISCIIHRKSFKSIYNVITARVEPLLEEKYSPIMSRSKELYGSVHESAIDDRKIWFCWLQGMEEAPDIVRACYHSLRENITDRPIVTIDSRNWKEYVTLPGYIVGKWERGIIPPALFSDILRLELLIRYGGSWIDSTVLCTGSGFPKGFIDSDLFLFRYSRPEDTAAISISNWFITARSSHPLLMTLRDMLFAYWKDYDCVIDYYIFHFFFRMLSKVFRDEVAAMPFGYSPDALAILHNWGRPFKQDVWDRFTSTVFFHKLSFRASKEVLNDKSNWYNAIVNRYSDTRNDN